MSHSYNMSQSSYHKSNSSYKQCTSGILSTIITACTITIKVLVLTPQYCHYFCYHTDNTVTQHLLSNNTIRIFTIHSPRRLVSLYITTCYYFCTSSVQYTLYCVLCTVCTTYNVCGNVTMTTYSMKIVIYHISVGDCN